MSSDGHLSDVCDLLQDAAVRGGVTVRARALAARRLILQIIAADLDSVLAIDDGFVGRTVLARLNEPDVWEGLSGAEARNLMALREVAAREVEMAVWAVVAPLLRDDAAPSL